VSQAAWPRARNGQPPSRCSGSLYRPGIHSRVSRIAVIPTHSGHIEHSAFDYFVGKGT
jgi:hypothetical protein